MCLTEESSVIPSIGHTWHTSDKDCKKKVITKNLHSSRSSPL